jgi:hypothetical protein
MGNVARRRISRRMMYVDHTYKELIAAAAKAIIDWGRFEKTRVLKDAKVYSLNVGAVNWTGLRDELEESLKIKLVPVKQAYFDERPWRKGMQPNLLANPESDDAKRYLAYNCTPAGYISASSASGKAIVEAKLAFMRRVADGVALSADEVEQEVLQAEKRRQAKRLG